MSLAWEAFKEKNGALDFETFRMMVGKFREKHGRPEQDPTIGCIILTSPFFFNREDWIPSPENWAPGIVQGKTYTTDEPVGAELWRKVEERLNLARLRSSLNLQGASLSAEIERRYGKEFLTRARLGQGAFRVLVTEAYNRRCAITSERTLPVLESAHIKPFALSGPNRTSNGILLRSDLHKLFDLGYLTITDSFFVEVSKRIKEKYENGREYYALHGTKLKVLPKHASDHPSLEFLSWHNSNLFAA
jgi:putative restriction endonuclease